MAFAARGSLSNVSLEIASIGAKTGEEPGRAVVIDVGRRMKNGAFNTYVQVQLRNFEKTRQLPHFGLVEQVDALYERSLDMLAPSVDQLQLQLFLACHQSLLSAAAMVGRAQPVDSVGVTRRAVEMARTALAIKHDPDNLHRLLATDVRLLPWADRLSRGKPVRQPTGDIVYPSTERMEQLGRQVGILSDSGAPLTPEFFVTLERRILHDGKRRGRSSEELVGYFETSQVEIERALMSLASTHMLIVKAFDEECFEGVFSLDRGWNRLFAEIGAKGKSLLERFSRRSSQEEWHGPMW